MGDLHLEVDEANILCGEDLSAVIVVAGCTVQTCCAPALDGAGWESPVVGVLGDRLFGEFTAGWRELHGEAVGDCAAS